MQPIVDGLQEQYQEQMEFLYLDANKDGKELFDQLGLPGHPGYVIFMPEGDETFRAFGIVEAGTLEAAIESALANM